MANVANLRINAIVNDQATPALRRINGALNGLNSGMSGASGGALGAARALSGVGGGANLAAVGLGVAAAATAAVVAGTVALVKASVDAAAKTEGYRNTLLRLTGDAAKADATFKKLQDFADWSPFDDDAVIQSAQRLLGAGVAADDLTRVMTALSDVSGDSGETFQRASLAFSQMALKGKVSLEELNQLAEAGVPAQKLLADAMGVSSAAVADMASKGQLAANKTLPLLVEAIEKRFGGATARAAEGVAGLSSTIDAKLNRSLSTLGTALEPLTKDVLRGLISILDDVVEGVKAFTATEEFQDFLVAAREAWAGFAAVVKALLPVLATIGRLLMMAITPGLRVFAMMMQAIAFVTQKVVTLLKPFWDVLRAIGQQVKAVIEWLSPWVVKVQQVVKTAAIAVEGFVEWLFSSDRLRDILLAVQAVIDAIRQAIEWLMDRVNRVITWFREWLEQSTLLTRALDVVKGVAEDVGRALEWLGMINARPRVEVDDQTEQPLANVQQRLNGLGRDPIPVGVEDVGWATREEIQAAVDRMSGGNIPVGVVDVGAEERDRIQQAINAMQGRTGDNAIVIETVNRVSTVTSSGPSASTSSSTTTTFAPATGDPYNEGQSTSTTNVRIPGGVNVTPIVDQPVIQSPVVDTIVPATNSLITSISNALGRWKDAEGSFGGGGIGYLAMAAGGIVTRATPAIVGEAGPEAVIPLSQLGGYMGAGMSVTINVSGYADGAGAGRAAADAFRRQLGLQRRLPWLTA